MDFMPDLVIAKLIKQANMTYDVFGAGETWIQVSHYKYTNSL
jgi:hypothetical protein